MIPRPAFPKSPLRCTVLLAIQEQRENYRLRQTAWLLDFLVLAKSPTFSACFP